MASLADRISHVHDTGDSGMLKRSLYHKQEKAVINYGCPDALLEMVLRDVVTVFTNLFDVSYSS